MKNAFIKCLSILLCLLTVLPLVACGNSTEEQGTVADTESATEADTAYKPNIQQKNYGCDFNIIMFANNDQSYYIPDPDAERETNGIADTVYERYMKIQNQIGVDCKVVDGGSWTEYAANVTRSVQTGDDNYQMVMTHVYQGIVELVTNNVLMDISDLESVNVEADYWNKEIMDQVMVNDQYLLGYNDFWLSNTHAIAFNKDMASKYIQDADMYSDVRNKQWTFDRLASLASVVSLDSDGNGKMDQNDTYGIAGWGWTFLISFVTASDLKIVDKNEDGGFYVAVEDNSDKMLSLLEKVQTMYNAEYSHLWKSTGTDTIGFSEGRTMFHFVNTANLANLKGEDIRFGVLPYPLYDSAQAEYKSLNWNGMLCIPSVVKNADMVSDTVELLAYYTAPVKVAYFEQLLGAKVADEPNDADMLDVIWASQRTDVGLVFCNAAGQMDALVYMIPKLCENTRLKYSSYLKQNKRAAQQGLDKVFGQ